MRLERCKKCLKVLGAFGCWVRVVVNECKRMPMDALGYVLIRLDTTGGCIWVSMGVIGMSMERLKEQRNAITALMACLEHYKTPRG